MTKKELYKQLMMLVPVKPSTKNFSSTLDERFKVYQKRIESLDEVDRPDQWDELLHRVNQLCAGIKRAINAENTGRRHSAYSIIKNQLDGYKSKGAEIKGLREYAEYIYVIPKGTSFYRMREMKPQERKGMTVKDIFHIPFDKRGIVPTNRYSVPGYPCLYLSRYVYGCWEELERPDFGTIMVSRFENNEAIRLLDLRIPSKEKWETDMTNCLIYFPLVISTMIQVKNPEDNYKPEYTIPQLLMEWLISHNYGSHEEDRFIGIAYTSAQKNDDFNFPEDSFDNYAIPVVKPKVRSKSKYCDKLKGIFKATTPTYYDFEVLRYGHGIDAGTLGLTDEEQKKENMRLSQFGDMETFLNESIKELLEINDAD